MTNIIISEEVLRQFQNSGKAVLRMVTNSNCNKFYYITREDASSFRAYWGREDGKRVMDLSLVPASQQKVYPMSKLRSTISSKLRKGYKNVSSHYTGEVTTSKGERGNGNGFKPIENPIIAKVFSTLLSASKETIARSYGVSASGVSQQMIVDAQEVIDRLSYKSNYFNSNDFNDDLIKLFTIIPRSMKKVSDNLLMNWGDDSAYRKIIQREQELLDVIESQVGLLHEPSEADVSATEDTSRGTILDQIGLEVQECKGKHLSFVEEMVGRESSRYKILNALKVKDVDQAERFKKHLALSEVTNKRTEALWHGSRTENWLSILQKSLMIRPSNASYQGSMFGDSIYTSPVMRKSLNYTSHNEAYYTGGSSSSGWLGLFEVHVGEQLVIREHQSWCTSLTYEELRRRGSYDSVHAPAGILTTWGSRLQNPETMIYKSNQIVIRYLIEVS